MKARSVDIETTWLPLSPWDMTVNEVQRTPFIAMPLKLCAQLYIYFDFPVKAQLMSTKIIYNYLFHLCIACLQASRTPSDWCLRYSVWFLGRNNGNSCGIKSYKNLFWGMVLTLLRRRLSVTHTVLRLEVGFQLIQSCPCISSWNRSRVFWI